MAFLKKKWNKVFDDEKKRKSSTYKDLASELHEAIVVSHHLSEELRKCQRSNLKILEELQTCQMNNMILMERIKELEIANAELKNTNANQQRKRRNGLVWRSSDDIGELRNTKLQDFTSRNRNQTKCIIESTRYEVMSGSSFYKTRKVSRSNSMLSGQSGYETMTEDGDDFIDDIDVMSLADDFAKLGKDTMPTTQTSWC